jgi:hypothetical protein
VPCRCLVHNSVQRRFSRLRDSYEGDKVLLDEGIVLCSEATTLPRVGFLGHHFSLSWRRALKPLPVSVRALALRRPRSAAIAVGQLAYDYRRRSHTDGHRRRCTKAHDGGCQAVAFVVASASPFFLRGSAGSAGSAGTGLGCALEHLRAGAFCTCCTSCTAFRE